ncbi:MAG: AAA family ATPase [Leptolyngbyaceae cyanobacterium SM2_5_2]|nr:AAA family ATPase [Leptolyngbyaceae cyanobacterium SM2_5_2]
MNDELFQRFTQASRNFNLFPLLSSEDIDAFRVTYGSRTLAKLENDILALEPDGKLIFTGHRGCGKSTLLNELALNMRKQGLFVSFFSIATMVEMSDVNHINILYSIALKLLQRAIKLELPIPITTQEALKTWFTQTRTIEYTNQLQQELAAGVDFFNFFTGKLQKEDSFREEIKQTYERRVTELAQHIDQIAAAIQAATGEEVLVIIDDLDKLDLAVVEAIFRDNINALFSPHIRILFTIPIAVVRDTRLKASLDAVCKIELLPVVKFYRQDVAHQPDATPIEASVKTLQAVIEKRIAPDLVEPDVLQQMVLLSGGVLRELVRIGQECCRECLLELKLNPTNTSLTINQAILTEAIKSLRNQYARPLGTNLYGLLTATYHAFSPPDAGDPKFLELLHGLYVLEYENDDLWYDLHPLVADLLKRKNLI